MQTAFYIGSLDVHWYAITYLLGFLIAIIIGCFKMHFYYRVSYEPFFWYAIMAIPGAILGARIWSYVIGDAKFTGGNALHNFIQFFGGDGAGGIAGLAILGGVILDVIIALIWFPLILRRPKYTVRVIDDNGIEGIRRPSV
ncbi:prolipoprotein diacylglyceryl transferase [bacterium]|nr:prolipoprotein diacylglyceryl transferase [bacterium]